MNNETESAMEQVDLLAVAQLLDDCLVRIYPEEFPMNCRLEAFMRFHEGGGAINRIATMADKLRRASNAEIKGGE